jgi:hypothetical protein
MKMKKILVLASLGLLVFPGIVLSHKAERDWSTQSARGGMRGAYGVYVAPCLTVKYPRQQICSWTGNTAKSSFVVEHCRDLGGLPRSNGEYCDITLDDGKDYTFMKD